MYQLQERFRQVLTFESGPLLVENAPSSSAKNSDLAMMLGESDHKDEMQRKERVKAVHDSLPGTLEECFVQMYQDQTIPVFSFNTPSPDDEARMRLQQKKIKLLEQRQQRAEKQKKQRIQRELQFQEQERKRLEKKDKPPAKSKKQLAKEEKESQRILRKERLRQQMEEAQRKKNSVSKRNQ